MLHLPDKAFAIINLQFYHPLMNRVNHVQLELTIQKAKSGNRRQMFSNDRDASDFEEPQLVIEMTYQW